MTEKSDADLRQRSELLWDDDVRTGRGPKRAFTRDDVVQAAIGLADRDGLAALTMQAVAREVGFTAMALYRYFPSKEALIDAIVDAAMGTPPERVGVKADWREETARWARAKRAMLMERPWLAELPFVAAPHGPNWLRWLEGAVDALTGTGLAANEVFDMLHVLDGYVRGGSDTSISLAKARSRGISDAEWGAAVATDFMRAIGDPRFPVLSALLTSPSQSRSASLTSGGGLMDGLDQGYEQGLQRVLDGIQFYMESRTARPSRAAKVAGARGRAKR
jgi:AcrR family transcriptional regulator